MSDDRTTTTALRRRDALAAAASGLGLLWTSSCGGRGAAAAAERTSASCTLSRELTEGPYWIDTDLTRRDITEGRAGVPLRLVLTVQDVSTCRALAGADVEIWHADAAGEYSGFDGARTATRYLRGHQRAGANGRVVFDTIYPGWYRGRTPHIHLKVHVAGDEVHTGQLFFRDSVSAAVTPRATTGRAARPRPSNAEDTIYEAASRLALRRRRAGGYLGRMALNVEA